MEKDADAFRTISEVGEELDLPQHVLRFWETRFTQIKPIKRGGGRRYYRPDDVDLLRGIKHLLYAEGYTIKGVQRILRDENLRFVQSVGREGRMPPLGEQTDDGHPVDAHSIDVGFGELPDKPEQSVGEVHPSPIEPVLAPHRLEPGFGVSPLAHDPLKDPLHKPMAGLNGRQEPSFAVSLPVETELSAEPIVASRKVKPKQLALFEGMGDEGMSSKDRETLRQALVRIDECRKILASSDLAVNSQTPEY